MIHGTADGDVHPNVTFVMTAHERLEQGDMAAINDMFASDIVWHEFGTSPLAGRYTGRDDVHGVLEDIFRGRRARIPARHPFHHGQR